MASRRSLRQNTSPRLKQKLSWKYIAAAGIALAVIVAAGFFIYLNLGNSHDTKAAAPTTDVIYSKGSGSWTDAASWEPRAPQSGDSVVLKSGHTLNLLESVTYEGIKISIYGTLWIDHASKLKLSNGSKIEVFGPDGTIDGGKADGTASSSKSTRIEYEGTPIWDSSMGAVHGYSTLDENGYNTIETMPVTLAYFNAKPLGGQVSIEWKTETETNNDYFTVERSADGKEFQQVATIPGAGNSSTPLIYSHTDPAPLRGTSYYRLTQTDFDGKFEQFPLVAVENNAPRQQAGSAPNIRTVFPNPFEHSFKIDYVLENGGPVEVRLMDMNGNLVFSEVKEGFAGNNRYDFEDRKNLVPGTYVVSIVQNKASSKAFRLMKK